MVSRSLVLAYHGCERAVAQAVAAGEKSLLPSKNEYDWLGSGVYFWEDSHDRAMQWALNVPNIEVPAVLGAVIDLGNCLNLIDSGHLDLVKAAHDDYKALCFLSDEDPAQNKGRDLRARYLD